MPGATCIGGVWALSHRRSGLVERTVSALIEAGMSAQSDPRRAEATNVDPNYYYRRSLTVRELMPAIGAGVAAAVATFYVTKLLLERTPLRAEGHDVGALAPRRGGPRLSLMRSKGSSAARNLGRR